MCCCSRDFFLFSCGFHLLKIFQMATDFLKFLVLALLPLIFSYTLALTLFGEIFWNFRVSRNDDWQNCHYWQRWLLHPKTPQAVQLPKVHKSYLSLFYHRSFLPIKKNHSKYFSHSVYKSPIVIMIILFLWITPWFHLSGLGLVKIITASNKHLLYWPLSSSSSPINTHNPFIANKVPITSSPSPQGTPYGPLFQAALLLKHWLPSWHSDVNSQNFSTVMMLVF